jgi:hypothetical protein
MTFATNTTPWFYKKYLATPETLESVLATYGVAIIPNVINEAEIEEFKNGMWTFQEEITSERN